MRALLASLALLLAGPPTPSMGEPARHVDRVSFPGVLVMVRAIAIDGLDGLGVDENALLEQSVELAWDEAQIPPGWVAPRARGFGRPVPLWQLGGADRRGRVLHGSALTALLGELDRVLRERGVPNARIALDGKALARLSTPGSDGLLLLRVRR
jgi:hypothetical protein